MPTVQTISSQSKISQIQTEKDLNNLLKRIAAGVTSMADAERLTNLLENLTWQTTVYREHSIQQCRICGVFRGWQHSVGCPAFMVT